jgi:putative ABC transport system permease protein
MFTNYLKTAIRYMKRQKVYAFINIFGLSVGVALFIIIGLYVKNELQHDKFHEKLDRIYRVEQGNYVISVPKLSEFIQETFPEAKSTNRFTSRHVTIQYKEDKFSLSDCVFADSSVFSIFSFPLKQGNVDKPLQNKFNIVLTATTAKKIFGNENPVGKIITLNGNLNYTVTAVAEDLPGTSSIKANAFASFPGIPEVYGVPKEKVWESYRNFSTYILLRKGVDSEELEKKMNQKTLEHLLATNQIENESGYDQKINLRPFSEVYFAKGIQFDNFVEHGKIEFVRIFSIIGIFILIIAVVNFVNLATARSSMRAKEVGMRKVLGSGKNNLVWQYLSESILIAIIATIIGVGLAEVMVPVFNNVILADVSISYNLAFVFSLIAGSLILGLLAGIYPSFFLAQKPLLSTIKGSTSKGKNGHQFRRILTVFQYSISVILIIATVVVFKQLNYVKNKDLGFDKEHIIHFYTKLDQSKKQVLKGKLQSNPAIQKVAYANTLPGYVGMQQSFNFDGKTQSLYSLPVGDDFFDLMHIQVTKGRNFHSGSEKDKYASYVVNEKAAELLGSENIIGKKFKVWDRNEMGQIVGVVKNFNFHSLHKEVEPLVMYYKPEWSSRIFVKTNPGNLEETIAFVEKTTKEVSADNGFHYSFLDESFDNLYKKEQRYGKLFGYFALIAIFIASLGLFGLALFSTNQRFKEIGIRKVFGSSSTKIVFLLTGSFTKWVVLANLIGWPVAYYFMKQWLKNFAYQTNISWVVFGTALMTSVLIAVITVVFQASRAANTNPAEVLRDE